MRISLALPATTLSVALAACSTDSTLSPGPVRGAPSAVEAAKSPANPTATWKIPVADAGLSLKSDDAFSDGTYSVYADGTCSVSSTIFFGGSASGDNTISFSPPPTHGKGCGRDFNVIYPDGGADKAHSAGLQVLESPTFSIPVGQSALRHFRFATSTRCTQGLVFGTGGANPAPGSDSVKVTRIDARTWQVQSQVAPNDQAYCIDNGILYEMQVNFIIVSSSGLP